MARQLAVATIFFWAAVAFARPFTGTFVADGRPRWIQFLSLTQTQENVTGLLVIAQPDGRGAHGVSLCASFSIRSAVSCTAFRAESQAAS